MRRFMKLLVVSVVITALLGLNTTTSAGDMVAEGHIIAVSCSSSGFSMFIKEDGSLWGCGSNYKGALGDGTAEDKAVPVEIMDDVISVSTGYYFAMAIENDGSLWTWGNNEHGQLGDGTTKDKLRPVKIMDDVMSVSAGTFWSAAVKKDGSLWTWGSNPNGELGDGTTTDQLSPIKIMDDIAAAAVSTSFGFGGLAIKKDGSLWGWGADFEGYLGLGMESREMLLPTRIMDDIIGISTSGRHSMVIKKDGSLWAWGSNEYGKIGDGMVERYALEDGSGTWYLTYPKKILDDVIAVSTNEVGTMAIKKDGSLWSWGWGNRLIALRNDAITLSYAPIKIMDDVVAVSSSSSHAMVVKKDESAWAWGSNQYGALGDGTVTTYDEHDRKVMSNDRKEPIKIVDGIMVPSAAKPAQELALPASSKVIINVDTVSFDAYVINDYTYFKLRDLALALHGTNKRFEVSWDASNQAIRLSSNTPYTTVDSQLPPGSISKQKAIPTTVGIYLDSQKIELVAFEINGSNYFKLRDIGKIFAFAVIWDSSANAIRIDTSTAY